MFSQSGIVTLASDVLVLGAAASVIAIILRYFLSQHKEYLPAPINAIIGDVQPYWEGQWTGLKSYGDDLRSYSWQ